MKKKSGFYSGALFIVLVVVVAAVKIPVASPESIPLPEDIKIIPPPPDTPKEIAAFSGKWKGTWWTGKNVRSGDAILIIEKLDLEKQKAKVVYAWGGGVGRFDSVKAGWIRKDADLTIENGLSFKVGGNIRRFSMRNGKLEGEQTVVGAHTRGGSRWSITMEPIE